MSKDGKILAVAGWAAAPDQLWSLSAEKTPKLVDEVLGNTTLLAFALSPDGKWLAEGREAHLTIWDVGRRKIRFQVGNSQEATASVFDVLTFSPNGKFLAFAGGIHDPDAAGEVDIQLWDVDTGAVIRKLRKHRRKITALAFSPDSKLLAAAIQDEAVCVWDLGEDKVVRELPLLDCCKLAFSPDGKELATADYQTGLIHLWNPISGEEIGTIKNGGAAMQSLTFSPDGKTLAAAGGARAIHLWNIETREEVPRFAGHCDPVLSVAFSPDGKTLASRSSDATVRLWDVPSGKMRRTLSFGQFDGRREHVCTLTFVPDGSKVIGAGGWFGPTHVFAFMAWNMASGETAAEVPEAHRYSWTASVSIAPDGDTVATADLNGIHMWSLASRKLVNELILRPQESPPPRQPTDCEHCAIFSPDGRTLATCDAVDRVVRLWDWKSSTRLREILVDAKECNCLAFSPDGQLLAGCNPGPACVWETATGKLFRKLGEGREGARSVAFAPDGRRLVVATKASVDVWDVLTGEELSAHDGKPLLSGGHKGAILCAAISPDGKTIASGSADTTILLWNAADLLPKTPATHLTPKDLDRLWDDLRSDDAPTAYKAVLDLLGAPDQAAALIKERVPPAPKPDAQQRQRPDRQARRQRLRRARGRQPRSGRDGRGGRTGPARGAGRQAVAGSARPLRAAAGGDWEGDARRRWSAPPAGRRSIGTPRYGGRARRAESPGRRDAGTHQP